MNTPKVNLKASMGGYGGLILSSGTQTGNFCVIKALEDSVITAIGNIDGLTSITLLGGDHIPGEFTSVTLTSGKVILYHNIEGD
jgi:hypothetical protein